MNILLVGLGGAIGSILRHLAGVAASRFVGTAFPWGTLFVNLTGSFLIGLLVEMLARRFNAPLEVRLFLITGILGGYTTFSAFALEALSLYERGSLFAAAGYVGVSVILGIAAAGAGLWMGRQLF